MPQNNRTRTIVGEPMTPELMIRTGGLQQFPPTPDSFRPEGAWVNKYRIHTCHGYFESGNDDVGVLRIERIPAEGQTFTLKVRQRIVNDDGSVHTVDAEILCSADWFSSPVEWTLSSSFEDVTGQPVVDLNAGESGRISRSKVAVTRGASVFEHEGPHVVTADWTLFDAVQRLPFEDGVSPPFDFLEGLSLVREEHEISYRGVFQMSGTKKWPAMHCFQQIGHGVLPYEYWLDARHRLLAVATHGRAYILDEKADERVGEHHRSIRERKSRRSNG